MALETGKLAKTFMILIQFFWLYIYGDKPDKEYILNQFERNNFKLYQGTVLLNLII